MATTTVNGITLEYEIKMENGKRCVVIKGKNGKLEGALEIPAEIDGIQVAKIRNYAFDGCEGLTSVAIPAGVTSIGLHAFSGCSGLTSVTMPDSVTSIGDEAFSGCSGLTSVTIPNSVTNIGGFAFSGCGALTNVTIPDGVTSIEGAFSDCSGLTNVMIPDSVRNIGDYAFSGCSGLTRVTIPDNVTNIGEHAFEDCSRLTDVAIPDGVASIGDYAFSGCIGLTSVMVPDSVTSIGEGAFLGCTGLTSVTLPMHLEGTLPDNVFKGCSKIEKMPADPKANAGATAAAPKSKGGKEETAPAKKTAEKKDSIKKVAAKRPTLKNTYEVSFLIWGNYTDSNLCGTGTIEAESEEEAIAFFKEDWTTPGILRDVCIDSVEEFEDADADDDDEDRKCWNTSFSVTGKHGSYSGCGGPWASTEDEASALQIKDLSEEDGLGEIEELSVNAPF